MSDMNQIINLYHPPKEAPPPKISFQLMLMIWGGTFAAMFMIFIVIFLVQFFGERSLNHLRDEISTVQAEVIAKSRELDLISDESAISKELEELRANLMQKYHVLTIFQQQGLGNTLGFSSYFEALSKGHVPRTWYTKIHIEGPGKFIDVMGEAMEPDLVPRILMALESEDEFDGKIFDQFVITRKDSDTVQFQFHTKVPE